MYPHLLTNRHNENNNNELIGDFVVVLKGVVPSNIVTYTVLSVKPMVKPHKG